MKLPGRGAAQAEPPVQAFFQAFPNPSLFPPRISKEFFGGFVGFQGFAIDANPKCPPPNFSPPRPRKTPSRPDQQTKLMGLRKQPNTAYVFPKEKLAPRIARAGYAIGV
jgi:hypothetical protein